MRNTKILAVRVIGDKHLLLQEVSGVSNEARLEIVLAAMKGEFIETYSLLDMVPVQIDRVEDSLIEAFNKYLDHYITWIAIST